MDPKKRFMVIACAVLHRECYHCAAQCTNVLDIHLCEKGLHDMGTAEMSGRLQAEIDMVPADQYDAILLAYGLCSNGTMGLHADIPIVLPRAHDCITLLMGSKEKYREYFDQHPGTYFRSSGWIEREKPYLDNPDSIGSQMGMSTYQDYVEKYGEENAKYLMETLGEGLDNYDRLAYIDTKVGNADQYKTDTEREAAERNWKYELIDGNTDLLLKMFNGDWSDEEFLVIQPGQSMEPSHDAGVVKITDADNG